jgi:hypothetical protein
MWCSIRWWVFAAVLGMAVGAARQTDAGFVVIDFNSLGQDEAITTQFSALGVTFSGVFGDTLDAPTVAAANRTSTDPEIFTMTATFSLPIAHAGFDVVLIGFTDTISVSEFRSGTFIGGGILPIPVLSVPPPITVLVNDPAGFDRIEIRASSDAFALAESGVVIDNFQFNDD